MTTNSIFVKIPVQNYIINCLSTDGYDTPSDTLKEKLQLVFDEFKNAAIFPNNIKRLGTYQACFIDWLNGAPSVLSIELYTHKIMDIMASWGLPLPANKDEMDGVNLFHYLIYREFMNLCKKNKVEINYN
ncbi:MAG: hypothetical protein ABIP51_23705 [Bacteroidia bacterium]